LDWICDCQSDLGFWMCVIYIQVLLLDCWKGCCLNNNKKEELIILLSFSQYFFSNKQFFLYSLSFCPIFRYRVKDYKVAFFVSKLH
jgi:hypothetical protein